MILRGVRRSLREMFLPPVGLETAGPETPADLGDFAGTYSSPELQVTWTIHPQADHLEVRRHRDPGTVMAPLFGDVFSDDWTPIFGFPSAFTIVFERDEVGTVSEFRASGARVRNVWFGRMD